MSAAMNLKIFQIQFYDDHEQKLFQNKFQLNVVQIDCREKYCDFPFQKISFLSQIEQD